MQIETPEDLHESLRLRAMRMLGRRAYSSAKLQQKLREDAAAKEFPAEVVEDIVGAIIARLVELRLIDDRRYAESFVRDRFERAGYGSHRIRRDLEAAGITPAEAAAAIAAHIDEAAERRCAAAVLERFRRRGGEERRTDREFRHLIGRGFPASIVRDLIRVSL